MKRTVLAVAGAFIAMICLAVAANFLKHLPAPTQGSCVVAASIDYASIRYDLDHAKKGDLVFYDGQWCMVTGSRFVSRGNEGNAVMLRPSNGVGGTQVYYNDSSVTTKIKRVVRWEDPYKDERLTHALWTQAARQFMMQ